jgi:hypothetical protein
MPLPTDVIANALSYLTIDKLSEMKPADRQVLRDECERLCRIIEGDGAAGAAQKASSPRDTVGVLRQAWETD